MIAATGGVHLRDLAINVALVPRQNSGLLPRGIVFWCNGFAEERGYLLSALASLDVPLSSQILVFSKTSLQRDRISPKTPRALYFNDDTYVGFCLHGDVLELAAADSNLGTAFYTLGQQPDGGPRLTRDRDNCLTCHATASSNP